MNVRTPDAGEMPEKSPFFYQTIQDSHKMKSDDSITAINMSYVILWYLEDFLTLIYLTLNKSHCGEYTTKFLNFFTNVQKRKEKIRINCLFS